MRNPSRGPQGWATGKPLTLSQLRAPLLKQLQCEDPSDKAICEQVTLYQTFGPVGKMNAVGFVFFILETSFASPPCYENTITFLAIWNPALWKGGHTRNNLVSSGPPALPSWQGHLPGVGPGPRRTREGAQPEAHLGLSFSL